MNYNINNNKHLKIWLKKLKNKKSFWIPIKKDVENEMYEYLLVKNKEIKRYLILFKLKYF